MNTDEEELIRLLNRRQGIPLIQAKVWLKDRGKSSQRGRIIRALQEQADDLLHDPIEDDPDYSAILERADKRVSELLKDEPRRMGYCHLQWRTKKHVLEEEYGVIWYSLSEMNPKVIFD